jgi:hypothetical protein
VDAIEIGDSTFQLHYRESDFGPQNTGSITVYADDNIWGMDPVSINEGIARTQKGVEEAEAEQQTV